jgi:hypothetical protein
MNPARGFAARFLITPHGRLCKTPEKETTPDREA